MADAIWTTIERAMSRCRPPRTWADLARHLDTTEQRVNNWKRRRVPPELYTAIAQWLGMTVEALVAGVPKAKEPDRYYGATTRADDGIAVDVRTLVRFGSASDRKELADKLRLMALRARSKLSQEEFDFRLKTADEIEQQEGDQLP